MAWNVCSRKGGVAVSALAVVLALSALTEAGVITAVNAVDITGATDVSDGQYTSSASGPGEGARYFEERTTDISGIVFDVVNPQMSVDYGPIRNNSSGGTFRAGTMGTSHYIFWDPDEDHTQCSPWPNCTDHTSIYTFSQVILGVIWWAPKLAATDSSLGLSGVTYGDYFLLRGFEAADFVVTNGGKQLTFNSRASVGDWFRVVTAVPEPGTLLLLGASLLGLAVVDLRRSPAQVGSGGRRRTARP